MAPPLASRYTLSIDALRTPRLNLATATALACATVGLAVRAYVAFHDDGIFWPDEIYQSLEPAHRLAFGYGLVPWEFIEGARNWALPGLLGGWLWLVSHLGLPHPAQYLGATRLLFIGLAALGGYGTYRLALAAGAQAGAAALAAGASLLQVLGLYFSHRAMSENASAAVAVLGLAFTLAPQASRRALWLGASLLGLAVLLRLQCAVFAAVALAVLAARREKVAALHVGGVLGLWAFLFGLLDRLTWHDAPGARFGGWFHSAVKYLEFNLTQDGAARWGTSPWDFYVSRLWHTMPATIAVLAVLLVLAAPRARGLFAVALVFFALHSWTGHKEIRFLVPLLPVAFALAAVGLDALTAPRARLALRLALVGACAFSAARFPQLTFGDLGAYLDRPSASAWDDFGPVNRLLLAAHQRDDLCGLRVDVHPAWMGGSTYLHRDAPLYPPGSPPQTGFFNYAIVHAGSGLPPLAHEGDLELVQVRPDCVANPGYSWRLP